MIEKPKPKFIAPDDMAELIEENQRLREALEFYLEQIESGIIKTEQFTKFVCPAPLIIDGGDKAKKALKELEK